MYNIDDMEKGLLGVIIVVLQIIAIVDVINSSMDNTRKIIWALVIIFIPLLGVIAYFLVTRNYLKL